MAYVPLSQYYQDTRTPPAPRQAPAQTPTPTGNGTPSEDPALGQASSAGKLGTSLLGLGAKLTGSNGLSNLSTGAQSLLSAFNAYRAFQGGHPAQGALSTGQSVAGGLRLGAQYLPESLSQYAPMVGTAGGALGALTGLAGAGLGFAQGDIRSGIQGTISGLSGLAALAPAGATIGGVSIASGAGGLAGTGLGAGLLGGAAAGGAAGGAAAGGAAAGSAAAGAGAAAGASIAGALGAIGIAFAVGYAVENIVNAALGEGAYGKTPLPFGRNKDASQRFSSADNLASQKSKFAGMQLGNQLQGKIESAPLDKDWFLGLMSSAQSLAPNGEVQMENKYGFGGDWDDPQSPEYGAAIQRAIAGDPDTLRDIIGTTNIKTGETGVVGLNPDLTETFRTKMLYSLPPDLRKQVMAGKTIDDVVGMKLNPKNTEAMYYRYRMVGPTSRDGMIRFAGVKLPENHEYMRYDTNHNPPSYEPISVDQAIVGLSGNAVAQLSKGQKWAQNPTLVYDKTAGKMLSQQVGENNWDPTKGLQQEFQINPEYLDESFGPKAKAAKAMVAKQQAAKQAQDAAAAKERAYWQERTQSSPQL